MTAERMEDGSTDQVQLEHLLRMVEQSMACDAVVLLAGYTTPHRGIVCKTGMSGKDSALLFMVARTLVTLSREFEDPSGAIEQVFALIRELEDAEHDEANG